MYIGRLAPCLAGIIAALLLACSSGKDQAGTGDGGTGDGGAARDGSADRGKDTAVRSDARLDGPRADVRIVDAPGADAIRDARIVDSASERIVDASRPEVGVDAATERRADSAVDLRADTRSLDTGRDSLPDVVGDRPPDGLRDVAPDIRIVVDLRIADVRADLFPPTLDTRADSRDAPSDTPVGTPDASADTLDACVPETAAQLCQAIANACGSMAVTDGCGQPRSIVCGTCATGSSCFNNRCCVPETDQAFCQRVGCGTAADNCGTTRTVTTCCEDNNACTNDLCVSNQCRHVDVRTCSRTCGITSACGNVDNDGDGLDDVWEANGYIDLDCDGSFDPTIDTPLPEADPGRPNVYVKWDYMVRTGSGFDHSHRPADGSLQMVRDSFARHNAVLTFYSQHDAIPESAVVAPWTSDVMTTACTGSDAVSLYALKQTHFPANLAPAYHYAVFAHLAACDSALDCAACPAVPHGGTPVFGATGLAEQPGNDIIIALGPLVDLGYDPMPSTIEAGTFMHELGHNLGLRHGGGDDLNDKPNYFSVMNYAYEYGIPQSTPGPWATTTTNPATLSWRIDYSDRVTGTLHEGQLVGGVCVDDGSGGLNETLGLAGTYALDRDVTVFHAGPATLYAPSNGSAVDWDGSGAINGGAYMDVSGDGRCDALVGFNDWAQTSPAPGVLRLTSMSLDFVCLPSHWSSGAPATRLITPAARH
jgi:hypothetical protein